VKFARKSTKNLLSIYTDGVEIHKLGYKWFSQWWHANIDKQLTYPHLEDVSKAWNVLYLLTEVLDYRGPRVRFPARTGNFPLHHRVQNGSGYHPASYPMGIGGSFHDSKVAGAWNWPLTSI
jgi:hypothetical protein